MNASTLKWVLPTQVFTPNDFPVLTYIGREAEGLEDAVQRALTTPNTVISLSGPSKSGKTVLAERVIGTQNLINVSGAELTSPDDLWDRIFDVLDQPVTVTTQAARGSTTGGTVEIGAELATVPFLARLTGKVSGQYSRTSTDTSSEARGRRGLTQVEGLLRNTSAVIFIDDFHYMARETQTSVARQIRAASGRGIKFCVASVPHRSDDVVRSNHELRGRTAHVDTAFWAVTDLAQIAEVGFPILHMDLGSDSIGLLAIEACGSPQLMQQICLQTCNYLKVKGTLDKKTTFNLSSDDRQAILQLAANHTDYSSLLDKFHEGPRTRGQERNAFGLADDTSGDVYRAVLLGLSTGQPLMSVSYTRLIERTNAVVVNGSFQSQGIQSAVKQMAGFASKMYPEQRIIEWDDEVGSGTLSIVDPYLLFYIRHSGRLAKLAEQK